MTVLETLKSEIFGESDETYTYECLNCAATFSSTTSHMGNVECIECGSSKLRDVPEESP